MTTESTAAVLPPPHRWLRLALVVVAALELLDALTSMHNIFTDYHHQTALLRFAQALTSVQLALAPFIAAAAFIFALRGRLRHAILALAALALMVWLLDDVSSFPIHGFEFSMSFGGMVVFAHHFAFPVAAVAGAALAWKNRRLALAGLLVSLPAIVKWIGVAVFTISIMMYGF
jgi:hypothetical protein